MEIFHTDKAGCQDRTNYRQVRKGYKRRGQRKNSTAKFLKETFSLATLPVPPLNIWKLRAKAVTQAVTLMELAQIIQHIANHRGFSSTAKGFKDADTDFLKVMENVETELKNSSFETLSQYIRHKQREGKGLFAVRGNSDLKINRKLHLQELAVIWEKQKKFNPKYTKILTDELLEELTTESRNIHQNGHSLNFRRNLKSQNDKVSKCLYFPKKKATPVFCPDFEEFRLLKFVHGLQAFEYRDGVYSEPLDEEVKEYLLDKWLFTSTASVKLSKLRKDDFFGEYYTEDYRLNYPDGSEKGQHNTSVPVSKIGYLLGKLFGKSGAKAIWYNYMDTSKEHRANTLLGKFCHYLRHSTRAIHNYTASEKLAYSGEVISGKYGNSRVVLI